MFKKTQKKHFGGCNYERLFYVQMLEFNPKIDSAKLSIPLHLCHLTNLGLQLKDKFLKEKTNLSTGETFSSETYNGEPFIINTDFGTYYKFWIEPQIIAKGQSDNFISVLVNSKHLGQDYFKGVTNDTVKELHKNIMDQNVFKCSFDDFLKARYQDTDICFDFNCDLEQFKNLKDNILNSTLYADKWQRTDTQTNNGIWAPSAPKGSTKIKPRDLATPKHPYIKFYSKEIDFKTKSNLFAEHFNLIEQSKNIIRFECTIKNSRHKKLLKIDSLKTFGELLNSDLRAIQSDMFKRYFEKRKYIKGKEFTPMDKLLIDLIDIAIEKGADKNEIFRAFDRTDVSKKSNYNLVKKYHQLYSKDLINKKRMESNEISKEVFEFLGVSNQLKLDLEK